jgi:hypothetical protein
MPLSEIETIKALPRRGWLRQYVEHAWRQTTAPIGYHVGVGLSVLGATTPTGYGMIYAGTLRANLFTLLVGRSGEDNKSSALSVGVPILQEAQHTLIGDFPGSMEGLIESLALNQTQMIPISEFGRFLSSAQRGYFEPVKTLLADLWDCGPTQRRRASTRTRTGETQENIIRVPNPRLSIAAACSIPYLEKHTLAEDWTGGFMGRWLVLYGMRERTDPDPKGDPTRHAMLVEGLRERLTHHDKNYWCRGLTPRALEVWVEWYNDVANRPLPGNIIGIRSRAPTMARKIALILAWDYGLDFDGDSWDMDIDVLIPAIQITELHIQSLVDLSLIIADHPEARLRRDVLSTIAGIGDAAEFGQILARLKMKKRTVVDVIDTLLEEGTIEKYDVDGSGKLVYRICNNQNVSYY